MQWAEKLAKAPLVKFILVGSLSFYNIYIELIRNLKATDLNSGKDVAIKFEHVYSSHPQLFIENRVYKALQGQGKKK